LQNVNETFGFCEILMILNENLQKKKRILKIQLDDYVDLEKR